MAANPVPNNSHVPGSGIVSTAPQAPIFFFFPSLSASISTVLPFFFIGEHAPSGNGGGDMGTKLPPLNGSYRLSGPAAPMPGTPGRFNNADSKATGGPCIAVPAPA